MLPAKPCPDTELQIKGVLGFSAHNDFYCHQTKITQQYRHGRSRATMARTDSSYQRIFVSWLNLDGGRENTRSLVL